jgi:ATP-dependent DNA helicase RecQ
MEFSKPPGSPESALPAVDPILELARERFAIAALSPWQRFAIANTLERTNQLVVLPTGGGKSVCFLLPALLLPGVTVVVVPLLSLLKDQERRLRELNIPAEVLRGGQESGERERVYERLSSGASKIVFTVPEMLAQPAPAGRLRAIGIGHLVIDEAHCVSEWGKTFRPDYLCLGDAARALGEPLVSAYTATASPPIVRDIGAFVFQDRPWVRATESPDRPNIFYRVLPVLSKSLALADLARRSAKPLVVFTRSRPGAELSARLLRRRLGTDDVYYYHAGLEREERRRVEEWFFSSGTGVLCATSAYGMGIDKPDIRTVIHRDVSPSVEAYLQESGRAGRDGAPARATLLYGHEDRLFGDGLSSAMEKERFAAMVAYAAGDKNCRRRHLLAALGHPPSGCSGCDVCAGERISAAAGLKEIIAVVKRAPRRYSRRELIALLAGRETYETLRHGLPDHRNFGILRAWEREDIEEALDQLELMAIIKAPEKGFFRHRYQLCPDS